ncbi:MAG: DUF4159 domain-containing protein [Pseudomonadota bacterium]
MLGLGALAFAQPWFLAGLIALPALWWLLRLVPPPPREIAFPPIRLLLLLTGRETTARRTPWWLLLLRLTAVALLILAAARPLLFPAERLAGGGAFVVVVDDGWAAAPHWTAMRSRALAEIAQAEREGREVVLVMTAPTIDGVDATATSGSAASERLAAHRPVSWWPDRAAAAAALAALDDNRAGSLWLSDGIVRNDEDRAAAAALVDALAGLGPVRVLAPPRTERAELLVPAGDAGGALALAVRRAGIAGSTTSSVRALAGANDVLARVPLELVEGASSATARFTLPGDVLDRVRRFEREPLRSAGDVVVTDQGLGSRHVGLVAAAGPREVQPLLAERFFVERALAGQARLTAGPIDEVLDAEVSTVVLVDTEELSGTQQDALQSWIEDGGVLLRFAGPRLAERTDDPLLPVRLREGGRLLEGALSWSQPLALGGFVADGPLAGLPIAPDVRIRRQVLAEPSPETAAATLADLADGTPLVTGRRLGDGWLMLVHTTANTQWSDLPLSGTYAALLARAADLGRGRRGPIEGLLQPVSVLDAYGRLVDPDPTVRPVPAGELVSGTVGPTRPPGLYADPVTGATLALNLATTDDVIQSLDPADLGRAIAPLAAGREADLAPWLLVGAFALLLVDLAVVGLLRGQGFGRRLRPAAVALLVVGAPGVAHAVDSLAVTTATPLAYVASGDPELDRLAAAGIEGLARTLFRRTSVEPGELVAVDIAVDPLELFPILFWPVPDSVRPLDEDSVARFLAFLEGGGMVVFDTRDANLSFGGTLADTPGMERLRTLLGEIDLPPLAAVDPDHALTKSFYLLQDFPGRFAGQPLWVDVAQPGVNDGVSSIVIGSHDWLGAWATDDLDRPLLPVVPGGERQREMARRVGVNLVMYALTGNYKTDQVHIPTLLERLGQ